MADKQYDCPCFDIIRVSARYCVIQTDSGRFHSSSAESHKICVFVNGALKSISDRAVIVIGELLPDNDYIIALRYENGTHEASHKIHTKAESYLLDVHDFGAIGDAISDDTVKLQAAISSCPEGGCVHLTCGEYRVTSLFFRSDISLWFDKDANLLFETDRRSVPVLPGLLSSANGENELPLASWEGNPLDSFSAAINLINCHNIDIFGEGNIRGRADESDWWDSPKIPRPAFRPRLIYAKNATNIAICGISLYNSPSWACHINHCDNVSITGISVKSPAASVNTDALVIESCDSVDIRGCLLDVGDDCVAIKSGKLMMTKLEKRRCCNVSVSHCKMLNGHGAVTIGSEIACGVTDIHVEACDFFGTERGLRIKSRRDRGDCLIDRINFSDIFMSDVGVPFVINAQYYFDPANSLNELDSEKLDTSPTLGTFVFRDVTAIKCNYSAGFILGSPDKPIQRVEMHRCLVTFADSPRPGLPAMCAAAKIGVKQPFFAENVGELIIDGDCKLAT